MQEKVVLPILPVSIFIILKLYFTALVVVQRDSHGCSSHDP